MKKDSVRKKFIEELEKTPIISVACEKIGISRNTFYRWLKEDNYFALDVDKAMNMGVSLVSDFAESNVLNGIKNKDSKYTMYWLSHRHSEYRRQFTRDNEKEHYKAESREKRIKMLEADIEAQKWFDTWVKAKQDMDKRNKKNQITT